MYVYLNKYRISYKKNILLHCHYYITASFTIKRKIYA